MSQTHDEIRALRVMVDELRAEPPPELPWDAIERSLLARLDAPLPAPRGLRRAAPPRAESAFSRVLGFAAAAAALALGVTMGGPERSPQTPPAAPPIEVSAIPAAPGLAGHDLARLAPGDVIEASDAPVTFAQQGLVSWTLAPGSTARVRTVGLGHTLELERGALRAEVTPRSPAEGLIEAFAVEVGGTRVAVHGTAFSVTREGDRVIVDVEHGAVAVGPVGHVGATTGHLLVGPSRASFSLDGGRSARLLDRPLVVAMGGPERSPQTPPVAIGDAPKPAAPVVTDEPAPSPAQPVALAEAPKPAAAHHLGAAPADMGGTPMPPRTAAPEPQAAAPAPHAEAPRLTADVVRGRLARCFKQAEPAREPGASTVVIEPITVTLRIDINPDGTMRSARFDRLVKPELATCAGTAVSGLFPEGLGHMDVPVTFQP